jgi:DNA (cytosine-5)-methyltransferase 1
MTYTMGSLFAGIGGFDLGFERAGFKTLWQVEIDPYAQKVLAKNFPEAERFGDIRECGSHNLKPVDVICGGFPCQDISNAGKQAGIEGARSGLWSEYARIIGELRPKFVLVENVAALLGRGMGRVIGDLASIGYDAEWDVISAKDVGAPHLRERVWIVSYPKTQRFQEAGKFRRKQPSEWISSKGEAGISPYARKERIHGSGEEQVSWLSGFSWCKDVRRAEDLRGRSDIPEPLFRGARDGVPNWVDRIGACGNAVVPQIPEMFAHRIREALEAS